MFAAGKTAIVASAANYIEDVFSTYLYTGTGASRSITNGINLSTYGGLVWVKDRGVNVDHALTDTARGNTKQIFSNLFDPEVTPSPAPISSFDTTGFSLPASSNNVDNNYPGENYVSWTFRKQAKFFDVLTYTGTGSVQTISHALGSVPACIIVKRVASYSDWQVYHRSLANTEYMVLNSTAAKATGTTRWNSTTPTSTVFTVGTDSTVNASGQTYIAYLFAHDAGGFGLTGTDNVISCGSFTTDASGFADINLGYEAQWALVKKSSSTGAWAITDNMRGWVTGAALNTSDDAVLFPSATNAETTQGRGYPTATGFSYADSASSTYIYIAIRRGPMKVPTSGTSVFTPVTATIANPDTATTNFPVDLLISTVTNPAGSENRYVSDRLRGTQTTAGRILYTNLDASETATSPYGYGIDSNTTITDKLLGPYAGQTGKTAIYWNFRRAPSFFDEVCYTGTGSARNINHNLGVAPQMMIVKSRSLAGSYWYVYYGQTTKTLSLNIADGAYDDGGAVWNSTAPTSTVFSLGTAGDVNGSGYTYVNYLFATCPGVSKVGSYTGTGATQTISCGFTGGARFVLVKRTDSTGGWYVWDTTRGMVAGTDPSLFFNDSAIQVNANSVYTTTGGFQIVSTASGINASGGTYIFLAIA